MPEAIETKIDRIATDVAYMRGQYESTIPDLKKVIDDHSRRINGVEQTQANIKGKVAIISVAGGGVMSVIAMWVKSHFFT